MTQPNIPALDHPEHTKYIRRRNTDGFRLKYALSHAERRALVRAAGVQCLVLFEYYLRLASTENTVITDQAAAEYFDWGLRTAIKWRRTLQRLGWINFVKARLPQGRVIHTYYLGLDEVQASNINYNNINGEG
jgi:hypothetical protein